VRSVFVYDDEVVGAGQRQNEWLHIIADYVQDIGLTFKGQGRCSKKHITREVLEDLYRMGFRAIMWGVESFSERVLKAIKKGTTEEDIWHTLELSRKVGLKNFVFLMVGNYQETVEDLAYTAKQLNKAASLVDWKQVTVCTPLPGTEFWSNAEEEGWLETPPEGGPQMAQAYGSTKWLTKRQIWNWKRRLEAI
jgi:radical SAM superfamily enzyme YgiQ (UPF0313 family)